MAIVINGSGTVTGISVGGLPDGIIDNGTMADDAIAIADLAATGTASSSTFLRGDNSWQAAGSTSASDLTSGTLPAARIANTSILAEKLALGASNIRTTDQAVIAYKNLDGSGHFELKSFTIPERGIWQINAELRMGFNNNAGFLGLIMGYQVLEE